MNEYIKRAEAIAIVEYAEDEHPYSKDKERPETYSDYNQGWSDACDYIECRLEAVQPADADIMRQLHISRMRMWDNALCRLRDAITERDHQKVQSRYCPHCGAKMDENDNNETD